MSLAGPTRQRNQANETSKQCGSACQVAEYGLHAACYAILPNSMQTDTTQCLANQLQQLHVSNLIRVLALSQA